MANIKLGRMEGAMKKSMEIKNVALKNDETSGIDLLVRSCLAHLF